MDATQAMKMRARRLMAVMVAVVMVAGGIQVVAFAQTAAPTIRLINPDSSTSTEISTKSNGTTPPGYHFVAWVGNVPSNPVVEFKYLPDGSNQREIAITCQETSGAEQARRASTDTFDCHSTLEGIATGSGTVRAVLYSGTSPVAEDSEEVVVTDGQTVEILYPTQAGPMGFYTRPNGTSAGTVDVRTSPTGDGDRGTESIVVYYSTSAPGVEPAFKPCGTKTTTGGTEDTVRCTLRNDDPSTGSTDENDDPAEVTAIAAVARDSNDPMIPTDPRPDDPDAADAHRAFGYEQDPSLVTLDRPTQQAALEECTEVITATVFDQANPRREIVGVNVDVHAQGPTDNLSFDDSDTSGDQTSNSKPPEGHRTEPAVNCESSAKPKPFSGSQGEHDRVGPDLKHIESLDAGTNDFGQFTFQLYSPNAGATQFTVWADEDGNDQHCDSEAAEHGSVGWGQAPPSRTGVSPDQTAPCAPTTPTPENTPTNNPTTPGGTPTTPSGTPTGTATTTSDGPATRSVTLAADKAKMPAGRKVTFSGRISSSDVACTDFEFVQIRRRVLGTTQFVDLFGTQTDSQGAFSVERRSRKSAEYVAVVEANADCSGASSSPVTVLVKVLIQILPSNKNPDRGDVIRIKSSVKPQHDRTILLLQRRRGSRWVTVERDRMNNRSIGNFWVKATWRERTFRTKWPKQHEDHISNTSRAVTIRTR